MKLNIKINRDWTGKTLIAIELKLIINFRVI